MAIRQYIGARYVPKFFDFEGSPEWRSGVAYEALTIVTRSGNSYTSKIPVPDNIGAPESNPEYWVSTGIYNQQVESLRQGIIDAQIDIDALGGRLDTAEGDIDTLEGKMTTAEGDIDSLEGRMTTAEGDIDSLEGRVGVNETDILGLKNTRALNLRSRKFLFLGDSYIASHDHTCVELACAYLGITNYENISVSGSSFYQGTFLSQLQNYAGDKNAVTDIWIIGGLNDCTGSEPSADVRNGIDSFFTYQKTNYPNAHVNVCFVGHALDDAAQLAGRNWSSRTWARWEYQEDITINGGTFFGDMWQALATHISNLGPDHLHPSGNGQLELARFLVNYLTGASIFATYPFYQLGTLNNTKYTINNGYIDIMASTGITLNSVAGQTITGNDYVMIYDNMPIYFNHEVIFPTFCRAYQCNDIAHQELRGWIVANGKTLRLRLNEVENTGFKSLEFANNGNITLEMFQFHAPLIALL